MHVESCLECGGGQIVNSLAVRLAAIAVPASEIAVLVDATSVAAVAAFVTKVAMVPVGPRAMLAAMLAVINTWIAAASTSAAAI